MHVSKFDGFNIWQTMQSQIITPGTQNCVALVFYLKRLF